MKRRDVLTALAGAGALTGTAPGRRNLNPSLPHNCGCAPQIVTAKDKPPGAAAFHGVGSKLRITNMRVFGVTLDERIAQADRPYVFVKIETNQGVTGWGEATLEGKATAAMACVMDLKDLIIGSNRHWCDSKRMWALAGRSEPVIDVVGALRDVIGNR